MILFQNIYTSPKLCLWVVIPPYNHPQTVLMGGYTDFTLSVLPTMCVRVSVTFCYAPNFEKVGSILVSACPCVRPCVCAQKQMYTCVF